MKKLNNWINNKVQDIINMNLQNDIEALKLSEFDFIELEARLLEEMTMCDKIKMIITRKDKRIKYE